MNNQQTPQSNTPTRSSSNNTNTNMNMRSPNLYTNHYPQTRQQRPSSSNSPLSSPYSYNVNHARHSYPYHSNHNNNNNKNNMNNNDSNRGDRGGEGFDISPSLPVPPLFYSNNNGNDENDHYDNNVNSNIYDVDAIELHNTTTNNEVQNLKKQLSNEQHKNNQRYENANDMLLTKYFSNQINYSVDLTAVEEERKVELTRLDEAWGSRIDEERGVSSGLKSEVLVYKRGLDNVKRDYLQAKKSMEDCNLERKEDKANFQGKVERMEEESKCERLKHSAEIDKYEEQVKLLKSHSHTTTKSLKTEIETLKGKGRESENGWKDEYKQLNRKSVLDRVSSAFLINAYKNRLNKLTKSHDKFVKQLKAEHKNELNDEIEGLVNELSAVRINSINERNDFHADIDRLNDEISQINEDHHSTIEEECVKARDEVIKSFNDNTEDKVALLTTELNDKVITLNSEIAQSLAIRKKMVDVVKELEGELEIKDGKYRELEVIVERFIERENSGGVGGNSNDGGSNGVENLIIKQANLKIQNQTTTVQKLKSQLHNEKILTSAKSSKEAIVNLRASYENEIGEFEVEIARLMRLLDGQGVRHGKQNQDYSQGQNSSQPPKSAALPTPSRSRSPSKSLMQNTQQPRVRDRSESFISTAGTPRGRAESFIATPRARGESFISTAAGNNAPMRGRAESFIATPRARAESFIATPRALAESVVTLGTTATRSRGESFAATPVAAASRGRAESFVSTAPGTPSASVRLSPRNSSATPVNRSSASVLGQRARSESTPTGMSSPRALLRYTQPLGPLTPSSSSARRIPDSPMNTFGGIRKVQHLTLPPAISTGASQPGTPKHWV